MAKSKTSSFILTLRLKTEPFHIHRFNDKFEYVRFMYNKMVEEGYIRYNNLISDDEYKALSKIKDFKERTVKLSELKMKFEFSEYDFHSHMGKLKSKHGDHYKVGINILQKEATKCFQAFSKLLKGEGKAVRYKKFGTQTSVECKKASDKIRFVEKDNGCFMVWNGDKKLKVPVIIKKGDTFAKDCINNSKIKYCRLVKETVNSKEAFYIQIVFEGAPPMKFKKDGTQRYSVGDQDVGVDNGVSTMAIVGDKGIKMAELCEDIGSIEKKVAKLYRAMDRSRRVTNPENYKDDGTIRPDTKTFKKKWHRSKNYMKLYFEFRELNRKLCAQKKQSHNKLANFVISLGVNVKTEKVNYKGLARRSKETKISEKTGRYKSKKRFGKSILNRAPSMFLNILDTKLKYYGSSLKYINTKEIKASQYNHIDNEYRKKTLNQRWNNFIYNDNRIKVQRDLYSAYIIKNVDESLKDINLNSMNSNFDEFLKNHNKEMERLKILMQNKKLPSCMGVKKAS